MIDFEQALEIILNNTRPLPVQEVPLESICGRVLAEPVVAPFDMPLFDNSAVDGFGVRMEDVASASQKKPVKLSVKSEIRAGDASSAGLAAGCAVKLLTGSFVPPGVEAIVMREFCSEQEGAVVIKKSIAAGENIRRRGEEYCRGDEILSAGIRATPPVVGMLASIGRRSFPVRRRPRVAVVTTGNELVRPGKPLQPGQIYDSNSYALRAALQAMGIDQIHTLHAPEDEQRTLETLNRSLLHADVVISTGGVSVGDYDYVTSACDQLGVDCLIWKIAIKPGKPVYFGTFNRRPEHRKLMFGLPGNPVSALVTFNELVRPALAKMQGLAQPDSESMKSIAVLERDLRKKGDRMEFVRGMVKPVDGRLHVTPAVGQDSHMLSGLCQANCLIHFPKDAVKLSAGEEVTVELLQWDF